MTGCSVYRAVRCKQQSRRSPAVLPVGADIVTDRVDGTVALNKCVKKSRGVNA
jgi:hypothetical protein